MRLWDVPAGKEVWKESISGWALSVALSADGRWALVGTYDRKVLLYELELVA